MSARASSAPEPDIVDQELPMIVEVNDAGEILVPAELVQAAPHTRLKSPMKA